MKKASYSMYCGACKTELKRLILGSNILYYCRKCGCLSSELSLAEETKVFNSQAPVFPQKKLCYGL
ncbi:MAG: hypothetical protein QG646_836 [Euryarchaeota archaeon]|nr:hypothetical protein [Euryarchaeota archaeon]